MVCPLWIGFAGVKIGVGNWLSKCDVNFTFALLVHFIHQPEHFKVNFQTDFFSKVAQIVKKG